MRKAKEGGDVFFGSLSGLSVAPENRKRRFVGLAHEIEKRALVVASSARGVPRLRESPLSQSVARRRAGVGNDRAPLRA